MRWKCIWVLLSSRKLCISPALALPEFPLWRPRCVSVVGGRSERTLAAVVAHESEFDGDRDQEEEAAIDPLAHLF
jgi:hypothetical protein